MNKKLFLLVVIFIFSAGFLPAQSDDREESDFKEAKMYSMGDQMFLITAGLFIPLFFMDTDCDTANTNLSLGGCGSLQWQTFLTNNISLGGEFGGMFAFSPNDRILYMLPLTAKISYWFRFYPFEFPISLGAGACFSTLDDAAHVDFILKPAAAVFWNFSDEWAFGLNAVYWFIPQIYSGRGKVSSDNTMLGNFLETSLSVLFRF